jgi:hypothetical protein
MNLPVIGRRYLAQTPYTASAIFAICYMHDIALSTNTDKRKRELYPKSCVYRKHKKEQRNLQVHIW